MGWEFRGGTRYYYYKVREGSRVVSEYVGGSPLMEATAELIELERLHKTRKREADREWMRDVERTDNDLAGEFRAFHWLFKQAMASAGYYQPKRGRWRKKRMLEAIEPTKPTAVELMPAEEFDQLLRKATKGDPAATHEFFRYTDSVGVSHGMVELLVGRKSALLSSYTDSMQREAICHKLEEIEQSLRRPDDTAIANLLIESAVICWLRVQQAETLLNRKVNVETSVQLNMMSFCDKMLDRAHKRYIQTLQALAAVRRVHVPPVQVNIGEKQINVVQSSGDQART